MPSPALRNLGIVAHIDAGKTTVSERILFYSGIERRMGEVHEGSATMDWMEEERRRGITITAAATSVPWRDVTINLIDMPGHVDFTVEVERCMRVLDGAVLVVNGVAGVQAQSETVWRQMVRNGVASIGFVNQLDRAGADYFAAVMDLRERLGIPAVPVQYPVGTERDFRAVVDLISLRLLEFPEGTLGRDPIEKDVPDAIRDEVLVLRSELLEAIAEHDDEVLALVLEEQEPPAELVRTALRRLVVARELMPVLCGAALRNVGVQPLLDAVVDYLPAPTEAAPARGTHATTGEALTVNGGPDDSPVLFVFKLLADPNEDLLYARVYSGTVRPGQKLFNPRVGRMERVARVLRMHADTRTALDEARPGEIVALSGCKLSVTGDTLCEHDRPLAMEALVFPDPVITRVVEPATTSDRDKLRAALDRLAFEDPSFHVREDEETGQWLIAGMGELHLEIKEHRLADEFKLPVRVGQPRVAYREAPTVVSAGAATVDRTLGGERVFGEVELEVRPLPPEELDADGASAGPRAPSVSFAEGCPIPEKLRPSLESSLLLEAQVGPRFGFPMTDAEVVVVGGATHAERDAEIGFTQAASQALRGALADARVTLLEPVMRFDIEAPAEFMSGILGELNAKRADIEDLTVDGELRRVTGTVPLVRMFGYATTLRSLSQGRASFSLTPAGFRPVPEDELAERGLVWQ